MARGLLASTALLAGSTALAAPILPWEIQLAPGTGGEPLTYNNGTLEANKNSGPGNEQPVCTTYPMGGDQYVACVYMSSNVTDRNGDNNAWQCKLGIVRIPADGTSPTQMVYEKQLTNRERDGATRPCNHPVIDNDGAYLFFAWGTDSYNDNNNVQTYLRILDPMTGDTITFNGQDRIKISRNGGNDGAPDIKVKKSTAPGYIMVSYLENGDRTRIVSVEKAMGAQGPEITRMDSEDVVEPANIGRPSTVEVADDLYVTCASKGDNRPPEDGVACVAHRTNSDGSITITDTVENGAADYGRLIAPSSQCNPGQITEISMCMN